MPKHLLFLDFETYYDREYSLKKMSPANYILDPRYETIMCAVKAVSDTLPVPHSVVDGPDFQEWIDQYPPEDTTTVTFNALFDNAILSWRYGYVPHTMIDAMAMARTLLGHELNRFSLAHIAEHMGAPPKMTTINDVLAMRRADILSQPLLWEAFKRYAIHDNELCEMIFTKLYDRMPWSERRLMDMVLRCCVEPKFVVDTALLEGHIADVKEAKEQLMLAAGSVDKSTIMSSSKFQAALEALGVDIEYKDSPTAKDEYGDPKRIPAFSKTDEFMETLMNGDDPMVAALATARIGLKSTLEETRSQKLMSIGMLPWTVQQRARTIIHDAFAPDDAPLPHGFGLMPMPLRYGGAHTHRLSGDWGLNVQNMPTVRGSKGKSKLRLSLRAPEGHTVVTCDLGQIEARLVAWICGAKALVEEFALKLDPYNKLAGEIFGRPVNRKLVGTVDEIMGFIGKTGILGLGYGCGKENFNTMVLRSARSQGVDISQIYTREIGDKGVDAYRKRYFQIPVAWRKLGNMIAMEWLNPGMKEVNFGPVTIGHGVVRLPSGLNLSYAEPTARNVQKRNPKTCEVEWSVEHRYRYGKMWHRLYGPKLLENIVQALARIIVMNAALRIRDRGKTRPYPDAYRFVLQAHDELVFIVPNEELDFAKTLIHTEMVRPPSWGRDIPLTADVGTGASYGEAK